MEYWKDLFKKHILQRGEDYFYNGAVIELNKTESGYQAVVEGTEDYEVAIEIDNDVVADMDCSCPYAAEGKNCKHMAAVLFQIESEEPSVIIDNELPGETDSLVDVIASISEDEAKILLLHQAAKDPVLKSSIMLKYSKEIGKAHVKDIKFRIDCLEDEFCDRDGFINYRNAWDYGCALNNILESEVQLLIDRNLLMPAFEVSNHVFYTVATCELDDSDGTTNFVAEACYDMWKQIIDKASADETEKMFQWFKTHRKGYVIDYMEDYIDNILMNEFHDDSMLREKIELLDSEIRELQKQENGDNWLCKRYQYSHKIMQRLSMMKELGDSLDTQFEYAKRFRWQSDVRKWEVSEYLKIGNIEMAISVLKESCELDKDYPGIVSNHIRQLLNIYRENGRTEEYRIQLVDYIFNHRQDNLEYIYDLKGICNEEEWYIYREKIIKANTAYHIRGTILEAEGLYDQLLEIVQESHSLYKMDRYENVLMSKYPEEVKNFYFECIHKEIARADNRQKYKSIISYLKKLKKYPGGVQETQSVAEQWKVMYKNRTALKDELRKAGF